MIRIDARERDLISLIRTKYPEEKIIVESLPLGDCIIEKSDGQKVIFERKTVNDLISSIKDGRYNEQSYRLNGLTIHNHNVVYLIEGDVNRLKQAREKQMVYSSIFSIQFYKGFSLMRTMNLEETATYICNSATRLEKKEERGYYCGNGNLGNLDIGISIGNSNANANANSSDDENPNAAGSSLSSYVNVIKQVKKENITPENIGEIMLCQIPGVSATCAAAVMKQFKCFVNLMADLQEHGEECLKTVTWTNAKGQVKKINKPCCANIVKYLVN